MEGPENSHAETAEILIVAGEQDLLTGQTGGQGREKSW